MHSFPEDATLKESLRHSAGQGRNSFRVAKNLLRVFVPRVSKQPWAGISERFQRYRQKCDCRSLNDDCHYGILKDGKGHPRAAGTYSRILGYYVRETKTLTLMDALRKITLMPAERLERRVPIMKTKGRLRPGADADLTILDAERVIDKATYTEPGKYSEGIKFV